MDKLIFGLSTTVVGMAVVFFGLVVLIACIACMHALAGKKRQDASPAPKEAAPAPAPVAAEAEPEAEEEADDGALVAAITAAIAAVWQQESGFVVRRVRRVETSTARARAAREEQIYSRL